MTAPAVTTPSAETFGLPPQAGHLIGKLRNMPPEQLACILARTDQGEVSA